MEYIDGPTLSEYIHSHGPLNIETAIDFIKQILNGVKQAHEQRIIHRDIKPQNVLINKDKILKIFDFGIAKALSETSMTQTNHVLERFNIYLLNKLKEIKRMKQPISIQLV